ncbi:MAG: glycosyltransferase family 4 protein [Leptolyngbyaceae cyanobacterium CSU_1_3]|nr:glycosyltransferase family 4 protein [Leptolyngbyaceae cyanobacterium CSU_1_3]
MITSVYPLTSDGHHGAFVREANLRLQPTEVKFTVFAPAYEGSSSYWLDGIQVHRFRYCIKQFENLVRDGAPTKLQKQPLYLLVAVLYILLGTWQLFWVCRKEKPDLLQVHWAFPHGLMAFPASRLLSIPMVFCFHGGELLLAKKFGFVATILRWLLPMTKGVTANSSFTQGLVHKLYQGKVAIVPYGLTIAAKAPKARSPEEPPRLLFVGRLDERKGLRYLLEALTIVLAKQSVRLRIVGKGILEPEIRAQCKDLDLEGIVDFLGFVTKEELADEYATCDIFVLPAIVDSKGDTEGLGVVLIEALAHEKPVIASAVGGIVDVICADKTGLLIPEKDPVALAQAILTVLEDPALAQELGRAGLRDVQTRFSWSRIVPLWQSLFSTALTNASDSPVTCDRE